MVATVSPIESARSRLEAALDLAARGFYVFPCHWLKADGNCSCPASKDCKQTAKHPQGLAVRRGYKDATCDPVRIKQWWERWPKANIGIACGPSNIVAIDIDDKPNRPG